ncbi:porin [Burkholderia cepacia]|uniref:porin n=1 Tax=Burkholderia cepacia TaxID=292 RepID=UPI002AB642F6|nr:porin [Burkholderia cepacia]
MKKRLIVAVLPLTVTSIAHAQSSVTLYGLIDTGIAYVNNAGGHSQYMATSGNINGSRWGLKGSEDLGAGLKAIFVLENGFSVTTGRLGQGGDEFGRQAYVGLSSPTLGAVTFGRQYDAISDYTWMFASAMVWNPYFFAHPGDLDNSTGTNRVNNAIKYKSISYNGLAFGGMYSLGGVAGQPGRNQIWSLGANYSRGPLTLGAAYVNARDPNYSYFGNNANSSTTASNMTASRVYSGYASARTMQIATAGASYKIGGVTISAMYSNTQFNDIGALPGLPANGAGGDARFHNIETNVYYQFTPAFSLGASYDYLKGYGVNDAHYQQGALNAIYLLSKRTDVFAGIGFQHASGTDSTGAKAVANLTSVTASSTSNQVLAVVGMRHRF